jgi:MFS family permease
VAAHHPTVPATLRRARLGVVSAFLLAGFVAAIWVVNIPAVQQQVHAGKAILGIDLLVFGLGSVVSMQVGGYLIDRWGSRRTVIAGAVILVPALALPGLATSPLTLGCALFVLGLGNGALDLAMNDQAVLVERGFGRPIMSSFHACYSVGGAAGAVFAAAAQALRLGLEPSFLAGCVVAAILAAVALPRLLAPGTAPSTASHDELESPTGSGVASLRRRVAILAALAFVLMLAEGVANDWSALQAVERLHEPHALASLAYGVFAVFMTSGRLLADRVNSAIGPVRLVRFGSAVAAVGMATIILSANYPLTLAGWALFGIGISGVAPQIFSAAGNLSRAGQGVVLSRVVSAGYAGQLVGPAIIGWIASSIGLTLSFGLPLALLVVGVIGAGAIGSRGGRGNRTARPGPASF